MISEDLTLSLTPKQVLRVFDLMPDFVYVLNLDAQKLHYTNARLFDVLGYTPADVAAMDYNLGPVMVHDDLDGLTVQLATDFDQLAEEHSMEFMIRFRHKNGDIRTLRNRASVMTRHPDGRNQLVVVVAEDITKATEREKKIQQQQYQLSEAEKIFEYGSWEWDCSKDYIHWSTGMFKLTGVPETDYTDGCVPRYLYDSLIHPQDLPLVLTNFEAAFVQQKEGYEVAHRLTDSQQNLKYFLVKTKLSYDQHGQLAHVVGVTADVTQLENYKRELERQVKDLNKSNHDLEQFAYVASHDMQEPLRKIISFGERLDKKYKDKLGDEGAFFIDRMAKSAYRMNVLINDLLAYSRVSRQAELLQKVDLNGIFAHIISDLELKIQEKQAVVVCPHLPTIQGRPSLFYQLFQNLFTNALKFTKPDVPPTVTIESRLATTHELAQLFEEPSDKTYYRISISDNGIGFEDQYIEKIFALFQRLHGRSEYDGTGLGLAICRKIVEQHHGHISAQGHFGTGAEFIVYLPQHQPINPITI